MGFLDNTTNNIILDAVLTDTGRQFLARNDGSFSIFKFALGDDEINYGNIVKYGLTVGKEKIQKNTPVFEALTNQDSALKYKLVSMSNPNLSYFPTLKLTTLNNTTSTINVNSQSRTLTYSVSQVLTGGSQVIDVELQDVMYMIEMSDMFLEVLNGTSNLQSIDVNQKALYKYPNSTTNSNGGSTLSFTINAKVISNQMFTIYGVNNTITTIVKVTGMQSGAVLEFPVYLTLSWFKIRRIKWQLIKRF